MQTVAATVQPSSSVPRGALALPHVAFRRFGRVFLMPLRTLQSLARFCYLLITGPF
jgi:hypothetical protein